MLSRLLSRGRTLVNLFPGEITGLTFSEVDKCAEITFADGGSDSRECSLWDASEWAGAAGLTIVSVSMDTYQWEQLAKPTDKPED